MYMAIIGDVIQSKEINRTARNEVQIKLRKILEEININYGNEIASNFIITLGDEFQGLLIKPQYILKIIDIIQLKMYPIKLRFGVGIGDIDTEINREMALGADGPAYHNARKIIENIKLIEKGKISGNTNILLYSNKMVHSKLISLINSNLQLCSFIDSKWTDKQRSLIEMMYLEGMNQTEAALELKLAQSSVQRRLKAAGFYNYILARDIIIELTLDIVCE